jgi:hypothetical protein
MSSNSSLNSGLNNNSIIIIIIIIITQNIKGKWEEKRFMDNFQMKIGG